MRLRDFLIKVGGDWPDFISHGFARQGGQYGPKNEFWHQNNCTIYYWPKNVKIWNLTFLGQHYKVQFLGCQNSYFGPYWPSYPAKLWEMKSGQSPPTLIRNHATSCKIFIVKNFTPEMYFVPKFQQNRTNGSKVKSRKPVFGLFLSPLWPWWPLSLGTGQMWVFAYRNAFLLEFWQSEHWFLRNVWSANCLGHTVYSMVAIQDRQIS